MLVIEVLWLWFRSEQTVWRAAKKNEACAKRVLDCLLIFWLNCNILTCCPTFFIFSVLYSFPHCNISSLPTLQHPLFQTFMPPHLIATKPSAFSAVLYIPYCNTLGLPLQLFFLLSSPTGILGSLPQPLPMFSGLPAGLVQSYVGADLLASYRLLPASHGKQFPVFCC